jgi:hypothetical protein
MFIPLISIVSDVLFSELDPRHLGNLRLVNNAMAKYITKSVQDKNVKEATAKYRHMVVLTDNTVRLHSSLGKTVIDLTLPSFSDANQALVMVSLVMKLDGQMYRGYAEHRRCMMDGKKDNLSRYFFHNKSKWLYAAGGVFIDRCTKYTGNEFAIRVCVAEGEKTRGLIFTLHFKPL